MYGNLQCLCFHSSSPFYHFLSFLLPSCCSVVWADICPGCWMKTSTSNPSLSSLVMCMLLQLTSSSYCLFCFFPPLSTAIDITYLLEHQFTFFLLPCVTFSFSHTFEVLGFIIVTLPIQLELFPNINCIYNLNSISISSAWHLWVWCLSVYFSNACHHIHGNQMNTFTTVPMLISHSFLFDSLQQLIIQMHFINF